MPARQPHHDAAWLAAENGILQPAVGPAAERRAAAKVAALNRASLPGRAIRRDSSKSNSAAAAAIAADASASYAAGKYPPTRVLASFSFFLHQCCCKLRGVDGRPKSLSANDSCAVCAFIIRLVGGTFAGSFFCSTFLAPDWAMGNAVHEATELLRGLWMAAWIGETARV